MIGSNLTCENRKQDQQEMKHKQQRGDGGG